jgi:drug/metabolite transporter (DMT)-like permease
VVAAGTLLFAAIWIGALALVVDGPPVMPSQADTLLAVVWLGLLGSFIAYLCYFFLVERLGATVSTMVTYVFPVVGVTLGVVFLGELLEWRLALGTLLVVAGMTIVSVRSARLPGLVARLGIMRR